MEIDHEIFSTVILPLPLIQERQLSVSGEKCAKKKKQQKTTTTKNKNWLTVKGTKLSLSIKSVVR